MLRLRGWPNLEHRSGPFHSVEITRALDQVDAWLESPPLALLVESAAHRPTLGALLARGQVSGAQVHDPRVGTVLTTSRARTVVGGPGLQPLFRLAQAPGVLQTRISCPDFESKVFHGAIREAGIIWSFRAHAAARSPYSTSRTDPLMSKR
jgi:hypothetical protein